MGERIDRAKAFFIGIRYPDGERHPSGLWDLTHPRNAAQYWAGLEEEAELRMEAAAAEEREEREIAHIVESERDRRDWEAEYYGYVPPKAGDELDREIEQAVRNKGVTRWLADRRREWAEINQRNKAYEEWAREEGRAGNPPKSHALDGEIDRYSERYPEVSSPEREQQEIYREIHERGPRWAYPEFEGPGYTEPPVDWAGWHHDHKGWTFTEWAEEHNYTPERIDEINRQFPEDPREVEYTRKLDEAYEAEASAFFGPGQDGPDRQYLAWAEHADERGAGNPPKSILLGEAIEEAAWGYPDPDHVLNDEQRGERYYGDPEVWNYVGTPGPGPESEQPGLLRIVPMERRGDGVWESSRERKIRGEPDPCNPLHFPNYSYWARGTEAAE